MKQHLIVHNMIVGSISTRNKELFFYKKKPRVLILSYLYASFIRGKNKDVCNQTIYLKYVRISLHIFYIFQAKTFHFRDIDLRYSEDVAVLRQVVVGSIPNRESLSS